MCGKVLHTYRALAGHLRHNPDEAHTHLKHRWLSWRAKYRPAVSSVSSFQWTPGDATYNHIVVGIRENRSVTGMMRRSGVTYKVFRAIAEHALGPEGYRLWARRKKVETARHNAVAAHEAFAALSPEDRVARAKRLFGQTCALEAHFAEQLTRAGLSTFSMNEWQSVVIDGCAVPREADLKIQLEDGRKVVVMCDGEAFHGPRFIFGDAEARIRDDVETAKAYYSLGYSVLRYSESEIKSGWAIEHLLQVLSQLRLSQKVYRTWYPTVEEAA